MRELIGFTRKGRPVYAIAGGAVPPANEVSQKWKERLQASTTQIQNGVMRVSQSPGQLAAQRQALYVQQVQNNAAKWQRKVGAVGLAEWQQATITKGIPRISQGAEAAQAKYEAAMGPVLQTAAQVSQQVKAMPKGTFEQAMARQRAAAQAFYDLGRRGASA